MRFLNIKKNKGLTLLEVILALSIGSVILVAVIQFFSQLSLDQRMRIVSKDIAAITNGVMRRLTNDGTDFSNFQDQVSAIPPTTIQNNDYIYWDSSTFATSFLGNYLVPDNACAGTGSWIPTGAAVDDSIRTTPLIRCGLWENIDPLGLTFSAILKKENTASGIGGISGFRMFIRFENSQIFTRSGSAASNTTDFSRISKLIDAINDNFSANLIGNQSIYVARVADETDYNSVVEEVDGLSACFGGGCVIVIELNLTGSNNERYLRTDGLNAMLAPIRFAQNSGDVNAGQFQTCAFWEFDGTSWNATTQECGLRAGVDKTPANFGNNINTSQAVTTQSFTDELYITYRDMSAPYNDNNVHIPVTSSCFLYDDTAAGGYLSGTETETPCGVIQNRTGADIIVQFVSNNSFSQKVFARNIISKTLNTNEFKLRHDPALSNDIFILEDAAGNPLFDVKNVAGDWVFSLTGEIMDINLQQFNLNADSINMTGSLIHNGNSLFNIGNAGMTVRDANQSLNVNTNRTREQLSFSNNFYNPVGGNSYMGIDFSGIGGLLINLGTEGGLRADNLNIEANSTNIRGGVNLLGDTVIREGANLYSQFSTFTNSQYTDADFDGVLSADRRALLRVATMDHVQHLENMNGKIVLRYVNVVSAGNGVIQKPHCLDFTNSPLYEGRPFHNTIASEGRNYARIVLVPIYFKTYVEAFGSNQIYTHTAQDAGDNWLINQFITGENNGLGAIEDGAGSSLAMVYCDYNSVAF